MEVKPKLFSRLSDENERTAEVDLRAAVIIDLIPELS